eukprot:TRINITY_DN4913_c0_g1_i1.p1 TRINITY_DN4913_c0_g1~~TRINITY_DN4913_c0_g1_i1.p1  ORF type:complete len:261 (-),score=45.46 TRINITY_DN4913_c0_g1_i1:109-891(-)
MKFRGHGCQLKGKHIRSQSCFPRRNTPDVSGFDYEIKSGGTTLIKILHNSPQRIDSMDVPEYGMGKGSCRQLGSLSKQQHLTKELVSNSIRKRRRADDCLPSCSVNERTPKDIQRRRMENPTDHKLHHITRGTERRFSAVRNSSSSVSSCESSTAREFSPSTKEGTSRPSTDQSNDDFAPFPLFLAAKNNAIFSGEDLPNEIHTLEAMAYRSVLSAFHARGPLDWQQEALLTDLRLSLHISNDEHRLELAQICSTHDICL